jgi:L-rhamnose mutarotase
MSREAFALEIRPDKVAEYVEAHRRVWPEVLEATRRASIRNFTIFLHNNTAFGYFECDDPAAANAVLASDPDCIRWEDWMAEFLSDRVPADGAPALTEIFRLD